jgi:hypothetical protein
VFSNRRKLVVVGLAVIGAWALVGIARVYREVRWTAEQSAVGALDREISEQLAAFPAERLYPASLSELALTYPDGGDEELLSRFEFESTGERCGYRVSIFKKVVEREFAK